MPMHDINTNTIGYSSLTCDLTKFVKKEYSPIRHWKSSKKLSLLCPDKVNGEQIITEVKLREAVKGSLTQGNRVSLGFAGYCPVCQTVYYRE